MTPRQGLIALVLHAHLPFVRHPEHKRFLEEHWFFEALTESYIPLLRMLLRLREESVPVKLAISITPTLCAMLQDQLLRRRYIEHLDQVIALAANECCRNRSNPRLLPLSEFYHEFFLESRRTFLEDWSGDLLPVFCLLRNSGLIEIAASAATHAILPIFQQTFDAARAQIAIGCDNYRATFGEEPHGFWLPECAYAPGIDRLLQEQNIRWFVVDAHAFDYGKPPARRGTFAPCHTTAGPVAFARDPQASHQVWSAETGYPGDATYRDFYRDIGFDLESAERAEDWDTESKFTGIKYHRVTGGDREKELYDRAAAAEKTREHAAHFVEQLLGGLASFDATNWNPVMTIPFDAELFGHWWFEGPIFLEQVMRRLAVSPELKMTTPSEFLASNPPLQVMQPSGSSWGDNGYLGVWLDDKCTWIYPHLQAASGRMQTLATKHRSTRSSNVERMLRQLGRELLLAQASDWTFLIRNSTASDYAINRLTAHLQAFDRLASALENGKQDAAFLAQCEERDNLFHDLSWQHFAAS